MTEVLEYRLFQSSTKVGAQLTAKGSKHVYILAALRHGLSADVLVFNSLGPNSQVGFC